MGINGRVKGRKGENLWGGNEGQRHDHGKRHRATIKGCLAGWLANLTCGDGGEAVQ